ncbi:uncharacterized protein LOC120644425 isoform X2 [Panicum virgatum]|uniref:uncharacterized protein LOC120644425 isoform X2 n=1 Tax=Panicum virgatum TaxID=38727 RepID=UPI0019D52646|nr:uncharacterized protein LOC120644425 isoform X2 [Panicum virgatum]
MMVMRTRMRMPSLMTIRIVMRTVFGAIVKAERKVQGRRKDQLSFKSNIGRSFLQHSDVEKPKAPVAKPPTTTPAPTPASEVSNVSSVQIQPHKKHTTLEKGPSTRTFIAAPDGNGYVSTSDVEDDLVIAANSVVDSEDDKGEAIDSVATKGDLPSLLVQCVLSSKAEHEDGEKLQCTNLFHMFLKVKDYGVLTIIDSGSCSNLVWRI